MIRKSRKEGKWKFVQRMVKPARIHAGMLTGSVFWRSRAGTHDCCEVMSAVDPVMITDMVCTGLCKSLAVTIFLHLLPYWSLSFSEDCDVDVPFVTEGSSVTAPISGLDSFEFLSPMCMHVRVCTHTRPPPHEASNFSEEVWDLH